MIGKLRRKFIFILMTAVTLVLLAVFISMLLSTSSSAQRMSENILRQALISTPYARGLRPLQNGGRRIPIGESSQNHRISVLIAEIYNDGEILFFSDQIYFEDEEDAVSVVKTVISNPEHMGVLNDYGLRWLKSDDNRRVAFADIYMEQEMIRNLIINSLPIGATALVAFFLISMFLARWAVRPVERAWARQRQFVADASHELKTPLTVILSNADMLNRDTIFTDKKKARRMEHIRVEAGRMKKLVEALLELAKSDDTENVKIRERVDFSFIVTSAILAFEAVIYDDKKELFYNVQDNLIIMGDEIRLQQLINILLDNAVKYCPEKGRITVDFREGSKKTVLLTVTGEGEMISKDELTHIFERFYRTDKSRNAHGGFGLGLSIAKGIVKEHNGKIWAESCIETGNSFYVSFPSA